jgi:hypothetical protein
MLQWIVIAVAVLFASGYVAWTMLPLPKRQRLLDLFAAHGWLTAAAARHRARLATPGCGNCPAVPPRTHHTLPSKR